MKTLLRALSYFRPDAGRIWVVLVLLLMSVGLNVLKPWPFALLVDNVLGKKPYPAWAPETVKHWSALTQITAIALALLAVNVVQAICSGVQTYVSTDVGLRGLRRVWGVHLIGDEPGPSLRQVCRMSAGGLFKSSELQPIKGRLGLPS